MAPLSTETSPATMGGRCFLKDKTHHGRGMLKKVSFLISLLLCGCTLFPGMQNPDIATMHTKNSEPVPETTLTLISITPTLVGTQNLAQYFYRVAPADILHIAVWKHPEFGMSAPPAKIVVTEKIQSTQAAAGAEGYLVNPEGQIHFPLIGYISVSGKTIDEISSLLSEQLKKYIKEPQVFVRIAEFRGQKAYVLGEVSKPGFVPLSDQPLTITDALSMAGNITNNSSDPEHIYVIRGNPSKPDIYWLNAGSPEALLLAEQFYLRPGDVLFVSAAPIARWNRVLSQLSPTLQAIGSTHSLTGS